MTEEISINEEFIRELIKESIRDNLQIGVDQKSYTDGSYEITVTAHFGGVEISSDRTTLHTK